MPIPATVGAFAIVPSNNLTAAIPFWERLGFSRIGRDANHILMAGWSCEVGLLGALSDTRPRWLWLVLAALPLATLVWHFVPTLWRRRRLQP